jgi:hypothetical protein
MLLLWREENVSKPTLPLSNRRMYETLASYLYRFIMQTNYVQQVIVVLAHLTLPFLRQSHMRSATTEAISKHPMICQLARAISLDL